MVGEEMRARTDIVKLSVKKGGTGTDIVELLVKR
jgi:hypothetical protein